MTDKKKSCIGITIGPIGRVAQMAKRGTKALWASSYVFSYLAREIVREFYLERRRNFLLPQWSNNSTPEMSVFTTQNGSGLFPDRYIFESEEDDFLHLQDHKDKVLGQLAEKIGEALHGADLLKVKDCVKNNFKVFFVEKEFDAEEGGGSVVEEISSMLDMLELEDVFCARTEDGENYLERLFDMPDSFLMKDAFGENVQGADKRIIKTTFEYAACELGERAYWEKCGFQNPPTINLAREQGNPFGGKADEERIRKKYLPYHNYIAVVKADGDRMGDTLKNMANRNIPVYELDKNLLEYNLSVGKIIREQGGVPVFLGGDDLLFFAPVIGLNHKTVFKLVDEIDAMFCEQMHHIGLPEGEMKLTLSFGISMSYYKFPIYEARKMAEDLLEKAKSAGRNRLAWQLRKHSGQVIEGGVINKGEDDFYRDYQKLIEDNCKIQANEDENKLFSSFVYWLNEQAIVIKEVVSHGGNKLQNYFDNSFEKPVHNTKGFKDFSKKVIGLIRENYENDQIVESMYGALRFILFVKNCE